MDNTLSLSSRRAIEAVVLSRPEVSQVSILDYEDPAGGRYSVVYATASTNLSDIKQAQASTSEQKGRVSQWKAIFNMTYRPPREDNGPDFVGWRSSYTNKEIPAEQMEEWLERTIERIEPYAPERVLEIGCGVGLLTRRLAPGCKTYVGTDFSGAAIGRLRAFTEARSELRHVELFEREATDLAGLTVESFDMAVINSVVQYFPHLDYLESVLSRATNLVASGGRIFIGDVRHFGLLPAFHAGVQLAKAPAGAKAGWLKSKVSLMIDQERELVISPEFFRGLSRKIPRIRGAEILIKRGRARNEMNDYRYDVVLHIGGDFKTMSGDMPRLRATMVDVHDIISRLEEQRLDAVQITGIPNLRVARDVVTWRLLNAIDAQAPVARIHEQIDSCVPEAVDPEVFWRLSERGQFDVVLELPPGSADGSFDATICRRDCKTGPRTEQILASEGHPVADTHPAANVPDATNPLAAVHKQQIAKNLTTLLSERLPASQQPAAVLVVDELPAATDAQSPVLQASTSR